MADGAWAMTNSSREVYGKLVRLMCWTHTHRNYSMKLLIIHKLNKWQGPASGARSGGSKNITYRQQTT